MDHDTQTGDAAASQQRRWLRLDLLIAVCALLISTFASAASWWQARLLGEQTHVLEEQLGAQVWPYVEVNESILHDTISIDVVNDGLGPAILRSETATVDGVPKPSMIDVVHTVLGPHLRQRRTRGQPFRLTLDSGGPGSVLRPGESVSLLTLTSVQFGKPFMAAYDRIGFQVCYCAIVPDQCWFEDSRNFRDPQSRRSCPEITNDLLHSSPIDELRGDI